MEEIPTFLQWLRESIKDTQSQALAFKAAPDMVAQCKEYETQLLIARDLYEQYASVWHDE